MDNQDVKGWSTVRPRAKKVVQDQSTSAQAQARAPLPKANPSWSDVEERALHNSVANFPPNHEKWSKVAHSMNLWAKHNPEAAQRFFNKESCRLHYEKMVVRSAMTEAMRTARAANQAALASQEQHQGDIRPAMAEARRIARAAAQGALAPQQHQGDVRSGEAPAVQCVLIPRQQHQGFNPQHQLRRPRGPRGPQGATPSGPRDPQGPRPNGSRYPRGPRPQGPRQQQGPRSDGPRSPGYQGRQQGPPQRRNAVIPPPEPPVATPDNFPGLPAAQIPQMEATAPAELSMPATFVKPVAKKAEPKRVEVKVATPAPPKPWAHPGYWFPGITEQSWKEANPGQEIGDLKFDA